MSSERVNRRRLITEIGAVIVGVALFVDGAKETSTISKNARDSVSKQFPDAPTDSAVNAAEKVVGETLFEIQEGSASVPELNAMATRVAGPEYQVALGVLNADYEADTLLNDLSSKNDTIPLVKEMVGGLVVAGGVVALAVEKKINEATPLQSEPQPIA